MFAPHFCHSVDSCIYNYREIIFNKLFCKTILWTDREWNSVWNFQSWLLYSVFQSLFSKEACKIVILTDDVPLSISISFMYSSSPYHGINTSYPLLFWFVDCILYLHSSGKYPNLKAKDGDCFHEEELALLLAVFAEMTVYCWNDCSKFSFLLQDVRSVAVKRRQCSKIMSACLSVCVLGVGFACDSLICCPE